ncbi:acyl-CoA dehydrogenase family protein [Streptomyces sp. URMC 123]|uniref:acyl-CoA dehydrogenase family protein n=1 Tax=Streptomyces sp. URMC 123 TaxID=3423403 RepID=UPI003F1E1648
MPTTDTHPGVAPRTAVARLTATAAEHAAAADADRRLPDDVAAAVVDAGFARHFTPAAYGGRGGTFTGLLRTTAEVAHGCAAAAWCGMIYALSSRMAALLPPAAQAELWDAGPDVPIAAALNPAGTARRTPDGWWLSGRWSFLSGVDHAHWALLCAPAGTGDDREPRYFLVPRRDCAVHDTWFTLGMRGTGSNTVELDGVLVPEHRTYPQVTLLRGSRSPAAAACYRVPLLGAHAPVFVAPAWGAARAAYDTWAAEVTRHARGSGTTAVGTGVQLTLARAAAELDAARLLLDRATEVTDTGAMTGALAARNARDATMAAELVRAAVDRVFHAGGSRVQSQSHPVQRAWRDVHAATAHAVLSAERTSGHFARHLVDEAGPRT